jgi:hypothetical protein
MLTRRETTLEVEEDVEEAVDVEAMVGVEASEEEVDEVEALVDEAEALIVMADVEADVEAVVVEVVAEEASIILSPRGLVRLPRSRGTRSLSIELRKMSRDFIICGFVRCQDGVVVIICISCVD